jgi:hypothetical protein
MFNLVSLNIKDLKPIDKQRSRKYSVNVIGGGQEGELNEKIGNRRSEAQSCGGA